MARSAPPAMEPTSSSDSTPGRGMDSLLGNDVVFTKLSGDFSAKMVAVNINGGTQRLKIAGFQIAKRAS
jgi:hypothetical protein